VAKYPQAGLSTNGGAVYSYHIQRLTGLLRLNKRLGRHPVDDWDQLVIWGASKQSFRSRKKHCITATRSRARKKLFLLDVMKVGAYAPRGSRMLPKGVLIIPVAEPVSAVQSDVPSCIQPTTTRPQTQVHFHLITVGSLQTHAVTSTAPVLL
jgi:hypothetical protein